MIAIRSNYSQLAGKKPAAKKRSPKKEAKSNGKENATAVDIDCAHERPKKRG